MALQEMPFIIFYAKVALLDILAQFRTTKVCDNKKRQFLIDQFSRE